MMRDESLADGGERLHRGTFLLTEDEARTVAKDHVFCDGFLRYARSKLRMLTGQLSDRVPTRFLKPPAGYPDIFAQPLQAGSHHELTHSQKPLAASIVITLPEEATAEVRLGPFILTVASAFGISRIRYLDEERDVSGVLMLSALWSDEGVGLYIDEKLWLSTPETGAALASIAVLSGSVGLIQAQLCTDRLFLFEAETGEAIPTPYRYYWERLGNALYNIFLMGLFIHDLAAVDERYAGDLRRYVRPARHAYRMLRSWPHWRPGFTHAEITDWDWNGWSNGLLGGAFAACAALTGREATDEARDIFRSKSTDWLISTWFPKYYHWDRRSTNHGLVIYSSHLVGARLLGTSQNDENRDLLWAWRKTLTASLEDGCFHEGPAYYRFAIEHALPLIWMLWHDDGRDWRSFADEKLGFCNRTVRFLAHVTSSSGQPVANFGDFFEASWAKTAALRLPLAASGSGSVGTGHITVPATPWQVSAPIDYLLAAPDPIVTTTATTTVVATEFKKRGFVGVDIIRDGGKVGGLFVLGSRRHWTHNQNNDCGGFIFEVGGKVIVGPRRSKRFIHNNAVCSWQRGAIVDSEEIRLYDGVATLRRVEPNLAVVCTRVDYPEDIQRKCGLITMRRAFIAISDPNPAIMVLTACKTRDAVPLLCFERGEDQPYRITTICLDAPTTPIRVDTQDGVEFHRPVMPPMRERWLRGISRIPFVDNSSWYRFVTVIAPADAQARHRVNRIERGWRVSFGNHLVDLSRGFWHRS